MCPSPSSDRGQAAVDYVALIMLVCAVLTVAATGAAGPGGAAQIAPRLAGAIRHAICRVAGAMCTPAEARAEGMAPCPVHVRAGAERAGGKIAVVRLGRDDAVIVERRSDGTVAVSFADGWRAGASLGVGFSVLKGRTRLEGATGVSFQAGRTYELRDEAEARRFLAAYAGDETLGGEGGRLLRGLARGVCRRCARALGIRDERRLPAPAARYEEGGAWVDATLALELPVPNAPGASVTAERAAVIGRRIAGARRTYYLRLAQSGIARAGLLLNSLQVDRADEAVLELTEERGRPVEARLRAQVGVAWHGGIPGATVGVDDVARWTRDASARNGAGGARLDVQVALDLRDDANRRALEGVMRPGASPLEWDDRLAAFGRRLDVAGAVDVALSETTATQGGHAVEVPGVAAGYERIEHTTRLLQAWSRRGGGGLRRREDCEAAA